MQKSKSSVQSNTLEVKWNTKNNKREEHEYEKKRERNYCSPTQQKEH